MMSKISRSIPHTLSCHNISRRVATAFRSIVCFGVASLIFLLCPALEATAQNISGSYEKVTNARRLAMPHAADLEEISSLPETPADTIARIIDNERESIFPQNSLSLALSHFTWGVDLGSSIDLNANDMSTFDLDINLGYKNKVIRFLGIGAGVRRAFGSNNTFIPVYVLFRSSFRSRPSLFFLNLRAGYSFNSISDSPTYGDISASVGLGINLAMSRRFMSHIIVSYGFRHFSNRHRLATGLTIENANLALISFGVNF